MMSWGKWAPLKLIIRALPLCSRLGFSRRSYLKLRMSKIRDRTLRHACTVGCWGWSCLKHDARFSRRQEHLGDLCTNAGRGRTTRMASRGLGSWLLSTAVPLLLLQQLRHNVSCPVCHPYCQVAPDEL